MKKILFLMAIIVTLVSGYSQASTKNVVIKEVALFKNGLGYFICEVEVPDNEKVFSIMPPAAPSHGTFWLSYPDKVKLENFVAKETDCNEQTDAMSIPEILKANVGQKVRLVLDNDKEVDCKIKFFAEDSFNPPPNPYAPGRYYDDRREQYCRGGLMIVEKDSGEICLNPHQVKRIEFADATAKKTFTKKTRCYQLDIKLSEPAGGEKILLSELAKGITWVPSYIVDITNPQKASLSAKAEIINETCDLKDVTLHLVTGYPHLQFMNIVSPIALKENLAQFIQSLQRSESERGRDVHGLTSNVMRQSVAYARPVEAEMLLPAYGAGTEGKIAEDLFFYPVEKVQIAKGEVGCYPLFTEFVPYKHIYTWDIPDYINAEEYYDQRRQQEKLEEQVWHCIRLENSGKTPWTTAPAETIKEGLIVGQDTLNYTPAKGKSTLRITKAINVKAEQVENEMNRKRDAFRFYGRSYDLVTIEGKLSITTFESKTVSLEISKNISGELKTSEPNATVEKLAKGLKQMNTSLKLTWTMDLQAGDTKEVTYTYEVYVRH